MADLQRELTPEQFAVRRVMTTRWADNDVYGHMNNAVHYQLFDSTINAWLASITPKSQTTSESIGVVAESSCQYFAELRYPDDVVVALDVTRLGRSSVTYDLALFPLPASWDTAVPRDVIPGTIAARGRWVHVYVDATTRRPTPIPEILRTILEPYLRTVST